MHSPVWMPKTWRYVGTRWRGQWEVISCDQGEVDCLQHQGAQRYAVLDDGVLTALAELKTQRADLLKECVRPHRKSRGEDRGPVEAETNLIPLCILISAFGASLLGNLFVTPDLGEVVVGGVDTGQVHNLNGRELVLGGFQLLAVNLEVDQMCLINSVSDIDASLYLTFEETHDRAHLSGC